MLELTVNAAQQYKTQTVTSKRVKKVVCWLWGCEQSQSLQLPLSVSSRRSGSSSSRAVWRDDSPLEVFFKAAWVTFFFLRFCINNSSRSQSEAWTQVWIWRCRLCDSYSPGPHLCIPVLISTTDRTSCHRASILIRQLGCRKPRCRNIL